MNDALTRADRISRQGRRSEFDLLRAGAAGLIFLCHFFGLVGELPAEWVEWRTLATFFTSFGSFGTDALLCLCGFFIARSMASSEFRYVPYVKRRLAVLYGPYLCVLGAATVVSLLAPGLSKFEEGENPVFYLVRQLLFVPGLFPETPMLTVAWALVTILTGYLLVPLWHWPVRETSIWKKAAYWTATVVGTGLLAVLFDFELRHLALPGGVAIYHLAKAIESRVLSVWAPIVLLLAGVGLALQFALATAWSWGWSSVTVIAVELTILLLLAAGITASTPTEIPKWLLPLRYMGEAGYSFYLLHGSITKVMLVLLFPGFGFGVAAPVDLALALVLCFGASVVGSQVLYRSVEKPLRENASALGEVVLSAAEQKQIIESLQRPGQARYSREESKYR